MRFAGRVASLVSLVALAASAACMSAARATNFEDASCRSTLAKAISTILAGQGEQPEIADWLGADALQGSDPAGLRAKGFSVSSPFGTDYKFILQRKGESCLLRLYRREKGSRSTTNDLTFLATEPLPGCLCSCDAVHAPRRRVGVSGGVRM
jgi:hypothetical protein